MDVCLVRPKLSSLRGTIMQTRVFALLSALALVAVGVWVGSSGQPATEGIEVHGNWTIDIHDPDGTLAASHEFANALTDTGDELLPWLFFDEPVVGDASPEEISGMAPPVWYVFAGDRGDATDPSPGSPCATSLGDATGSDAYGGDPNAVGCVLTTTALDYLPEPDGILTQYLPYILDGESPFRSDDPAANVGLARLQGSFVATQTGVIDAVETYIKMLVTIHPGGAGYDDTVRFTAADVGPYDVESGQTVTIKVDFTFS
jgi:hypothetical protein